MLKTEWTCLAVQGAVAVRIGPVVIPSVVITTWAIIAVLALLAFFLTRNLALRPVSRRQVIAEMIVGGLLGLFTQTFGDEKKAREYLPVLGAFFILILTANYSGLIPGAGELPGYAVPTESWSVTLGLALASSVLVVYAGIRTSGFGFFKHFVKPYFFMLPFNVLDEIVKPLSLSLRLYGSVFAEEVILASVRNLVPVGAPVPFYFISLFFGALQAIIFTMLSATYLAGAVEHHA